MVVCGSRTWNDHLPIIIFLAGLVATSHEDVRFRVAHGGAQGADAYAGKAAKYLGMDVSVFPADWKTHGKRAGFLRNKQMIEEFQPDVVLALSEHPITKGTAHTVRLAHEADIPVYVIGCGLD